MKTEISKMLNEIMSANAIYRPSEFWEDLYQKNMSMLEIQGVENFKRSLAQNYFNWLIFSPRSSIYRRMLSHWPRHKSLHPLVNRIESAEDILTMHSWERSLELRWYHWQSYKLFVGLLWEYMRSSTHMHIDIEEPLLGNPIRIYRKGKRISQDLANSILEYSFLVSNVSGLQQDTQRIAELGAGYGRLGHVLLSASPCRYFVFDIPPALYVSQWYLSELFKAKKVFRFRSFSNFEEVREELENSEIAFFTPNQLEKFPPDYFDLFITISTLAEMSFPQIERYLSLIGSSTRRHVYLKQWMDWYNPMDGIRITEENYAMPSEWTLLVREGDPVIPEFFNKIWTKTHR